MMRFLRKLHKWVSLLIGIQVLLWVLSGLMISLLDPAKVSGQQWARPSTDEPQKLLPVAVLEPHELSAGQLQGAVSIDLAISNGQPVYRIDGDAGEILVSAINGATLVTTRADAEKLAREDFIGDGDIVSVEPGTAPDMETRNSNGNYWRVNFSDRANTAIYISVSSGTILARRNGYWRVRDFFWMLHIMDYRGHEDFNNALVIGVALVSIWLGISGFILLFRSFRRRRYKTVKLKPRRA